MQSLKREILKMARLGLSRLNQGGGVGGRGRLATPPPFTPAETGPAPITKQQIIAALSACYVFDGNMHALICCHHAW